MAERLDTILGAAAALRSGAVRPRDLVTAAYERLRDRDAEIGAFRWLSTEDEAVARADALGEPADSPLWGIPGALKANICRRGWPVDCASAMLAGWTPPYDAAVVERLDAAGALLLGPTAMDEFAMGSSTEHVRDLITRNPLDPARTAGGSSGGSAAAVAAGFVQFALGSDTGGSVRQPAHCCGVVGMKPTWGRISRRGLVPHACSLDQIGVLARSVADCAAVYAGIAGRDPADATSLDAPVGDPVAAAGASAQGLRVGVAREAWAIVDVEQRHGAETAAAALRAAGATLEDVTLPSPDLALAAYAVLASAEASADLARYDGVHIGRRRDAEDYAASVRRTRTLGFGREVKLRILTGVHVLAAGAGHDLVGRARAVRARVAAELGVLHERCDVLLTPTMDGQAFALGSHLDDPAAMLACDRWTVPASLAGSPALVVPTGRTGAGLPTSVQLVGRRLGETAVLTAAGVVERALGPGGGGVV